MENLSYKSQGVQEFPGSHGENTEPKEAKSTKMCEQINVHDISVRMKRYIVFIIEN